MKIYKITEASKYLGISINSLKTLANNGKLNSFKTRTPLCSRCRQEGGSKIITSRSFKFGSVRSGADCGDWKDRRARVMVERKIIRD